jgi:hypothetical protein
MFEFEREPRNEREAIKFRLAELLAGVDTLQRYLANPDDCFPANPVGFLPEAGKMVAALAKRGVALPENLFDGSRAAVEEARKFATAVKRKHLRVMNRCA